MKHATLNRITSSDQGTKGVLYAEGFCCKTLELPWRDNKKGRSCIPAGRYECRIRRSRLGIVYGVSDIDGRAGVLIHSGNLAGDVELGYKSQVEGCILLGRYFGKIDGQDAVLVSKPTVREFMQHMNNEPFILEVVDGAL